MRTLLFWLLSTTAVYSQVITPAQQKALNAQVDYANQSADEMSSIVKSIIEYYPSLHQKRSWGPPRYACPVQLDEYYINTAQTQQKNLPAAVVPKIQAAVNALHAAAVTIDEQCKALDTYHKLEDYKQDNFAKAHTLIEGIPSLLKTYKEKQTVLNIELEATYKKLNAGTTGAYAKTDAMLRKQVHIERSFIDQWTFNIAHDVHTGWPIDKLEASILQTDQMISSLKSNTPTLKYPASSMWTSFQSSLQYTLDGKRRGLDQYNNEAKKSDDHSNGVYMDLINYLNGAVLADYNTFIDFSMRDGYYGLKAIKYFPLFEIRANALAVNVSVKPFQDIVLPAMDFPPAKTVIPKNVFGTLKEYIEFINESWRQVHYLQSVMSNFSSSAAYYKNIDDYGKHGKMNFDYKNFELPLSYFQKVVADSKALPPNIAKRFNDEAQVILNILKEMDEQCAATEQTVQQRAYEKDRCDGLYATIDRMAELFVAWDDRKEMFYKELRAFFESYTPASKTNSWYLSGSALQELTDLDREQLFNAKAYYSGNTSTTISTEEIDATLRTVIANEYTNMKGIEKYGRNNGLCPYTPYEDLPQTSKTLSEDLQKLKPAKPGFYEHPYHGMVYLYNDIVDDYNKFTELSVTVPHLPAVKQPEFFQITYPKEKTVAPTTSQQPVVKQETSQVPPSTQKTSVKTQSATNQAVKVIHDTVYIAKTDTVYLGGPGEDVRSMEGYATNNLVLLLDVSGSMNTPEKLPVLKESVLSLLSMMRKEDQVSIIAFSSKPKVMLEAMSFQEEDKIKKAIANLKPSGKTDGDAGITLAYKVADENYIRSGNNRIILATDGEFVLDEATLALIEKFSTQDIYLTIFNFGKGMGSSKSLEKLAALGKGHYEHIGKENVDLKLIREVKAKRK